MGVVVLGIDILKQAYVPLELLCLPSIQIAQLSTIPLLVID